MLTDKCCGMVKACFQSLIVRKISWGGIGGQAEVTLTHKGQFTVGRTMWGER
jgi:hypothetical protein